MRYLHSVIGALQLNVNSCIQTVFSARMHNVVKGGLNFAKVYLRAPKLTDRCLIFRLMNVSNYLIDIYSKNSITFDFFNNVVQ